MSRADAVRAAVDACRHHAARGADEEHDGPWCVCGARWDAGMQYDDEMTQAWEEHLHGAAVDAAAPHLTADLVRERDEALAEVERLRGSVEWWKRQQDIDATERDELRAEVRDANRIIEAQRADKRKAKEGRSEWRRRAMRAEAEVERLRYVESDLANAREAGGVYRTRAEKAEAAIARVEALCVGQYALTTGFLKPAEVRAALRGDQTGESDG